MDNKFNIAYLYFRFLPNDKLIAGFLILDNKNYPKDFRYCISDDINPIQRALYGNKLSSFLIQSTCKSLLENLEFEPSYIITNHTLEGDILESSYPFVQAIFNEGECKLSPLTPNKEQIPDLITDTSIISESFKRVENALKLLISK
ncbi:MAG: hypothetical protein COB02_04900 [Candidatus Cloacimonadota bacterium]|nr:MAG: hypothetical protein COB02_04900 [Candidatus Cloacimonadota bacterium]